MKNTPAITLAAAVAGASLLAGAACAAPGIFVDRPLADVGTIYDDQKMSHCFIVHNRGDSVLTIDRVMACAKGSCEPGAAAFDRPCKSYVLDTNAIPPGGSAFLKFAFDVYAEQGEVSRPRMLHTNDPEHPTVEVEVVGTVLQRYLREPRTVSVYAGRDETVTQEVAIACAFQPRKPLTAARSTSACFAAEVAPGAAAGEYRLFVKTVPPLPEGLTRGEVIVSGADSNDPPCVVRALAYVKPAFCVMPESVLFQAVDEPQLRIVFVRQDCPVPAGILGVESPCDGVSCEVSPGPGDGNCRIYVRASRLAGRKGKLGDIVITTDRRDRPVVRVPVEARGVILASDPAGK